MDKEKSFRQLAKEAKNRMKSGFWEKHKEEVNEQVAKADQEGVNASKVIEYYQNKAATAVKGGGSKEDEEFYQKVKTILDTVGETSDILGRLTDKEYYASLTYEQKQRYSMELSNKYRAALERYKNEMQYEKFV